MSERPTIRAPLVGSFYGTMRGPFDPLLNQHLRASDPILALFANGEQGAYWDDEDDSTAFTDTAKTSPASDGDTLGARADKSGNDNDLLQPTGANKPLYPGKYDNIDDFMRSDFTMSGLYDLTILLRPDAGTERFIIATGDSKIRFIGAANSDETSSVPDSYSGSPSYRVNGVDLVSPTRADLWDAITLGGWNVVQITDIDVAAWGNAIELSGYETTVWLFGGDMGAAVFREQMTDEERGTVELELAARKGIELP